MNTTNIKNFIQNSFYITFYIIFFSITIYSFYDIYNNNPFFSLLVEEGNTAITTTNTDSVNVTVDNQAINKKIDLKSLYTSYNSWFFYFINFIITFSILCFYNLIMAVSSVQALISFFGILISFVFFFFIINADYVGSVILMVYLGAIIIFFCFILLTINPNSFFIRNNNENSSSIFFINWSFFFFILIYFIVFFFIFNKTLSDLIDINPCQLELLQNIDFWKFNIKTTKLQSLGSIIYTYFYIPVNILGLILFISLVASLNLLNPRKLRKNFFYNDKKIFKC